MLCNVAIWDRVIRFILSIGLLVYAIAGGPFWFFILGLYLLITGSYGLCPIYSYFRIKTAR